MVERTWEQFDRFVEQLRRDEEISVNNDPSILLTAFYAFYHYYNADDTKIEDVLSGIVTDAQGNLNILGIFNSLFDDESVDFISVMDEEYFKDIFIEDIEEKLNFLAQRMAYITVKTPYMNNEEAISLYTALNVSLSETNVFTNRILCSFELPAEQKFEVQRRVSNYAVKKQNIHFEILFRDDIQEEIDDIESPKEYVDTGELILFEPDSICFFGEEKSFLSMVSAKSLKRVFYDFGSKGLLDSNLRFFVSSKKYIPKSFFRFRMSRKISHTITMEL